MKKFTKLFLSCAAVAALSTAIGVSAMAADISGAVKGTFDETAKTVTISNAEELGADSGTQVTFLVFKGAADTDISADSVKGIDQGTAVQPTNNGLKSDVEAPAEGQPQDTYTVKIGYYKSGAFTVKSGTFKLGKAAGEPILLGNVSGDTKVNSLDAAMILAYDSKFTAAEDIGTTGGKITIVDASKLSEGFKTATLIGDVSGDAKANSLDAAMILAYDSKFKDVEDIGYAGTEVTAAERTE